MNRKAISGIILALLLTTMLMLAFDTASVRSSNPSANSTIVLVQNFDNETTGNVPKNWEIKAPGNGSFKVDDTVYHGASGKSAKVVDNSTEGSPSPYRNFTEQTGTIVVMFTIRLTNNTGNNTNLEVYVDDGNFAGSNIIFKEDGTIQYRDHRDQLIILRDSYLPNRWYRIKMIINIPENVYNIHIDDHLEAINAIFTGTCDQIHRIIINKASPVWQPIGYIDDIEVRKCIRIPEDFPTIQEGIDAASPGDIVFVAKNRTYFENVIINKNLWLIGEDMNTTVIDGRFIKTVERESNCVSVIGCSDVMICGFTIKNSEANGVYVEGSNNTITNNIIMFSLGCGIHIVGSRNTVTENNIKSNLKCGIYIIGSNSNVTNNIVKSNDNCGVYINGSDSTLTNNNVNFSLSHGIHIDGSRNTVVNNTINSNLECGVRIVTGNDNLVRRNIIKDNEVGLRCEVTTEENIIYQNRFICNTIQARDYGSNKWDDDYPYRPDEGKGGGNYWSNHSCVDICSGVNQDEYNCTSCCCKFIHAPDGICDEPYIVEPESQDNYPLFLIQNVRQKPENCSEITYETRVDITATVLEDVQVERAKIYVCFDLQREEIAMNISDGMLNGTIPAKSYCVTVRYNVSVLAYCAIWLNSTDYPLESPYHVKDYKPPTIARVWWDPTNPHENQTIDVFAKVTEPPKASQVDKVFLSYLVNASWWRTEMIKTGEPDEYRATMPKQCTAQNLTIRIEAFDKAGNRAENVTTIGISELAELSLRYKMESCDDPCNIDFAVMSKGETKTDTNLEICNIGGKPLDWKADVTKGGSWLKITPSKNITNPGNSTRITITVNTTNLDPCLEGVHVGEISVEANGTILRWAIVIEVKVGHIIIDDSLTLNPCALAPDRCNVGSTQYYGFHGVWAHNRSDVTAGEVKISYVSWKKVSETGWANFNYTLPDPGKKTFRVEDVKIPLEYKNKIYYITSFTQEASNLTTIWDRVNIIFNIADDRIDVCSQADISWNASVYEYDGSVFEGYPLFNDTLHHDTVGKRCINTSFIVDTKYNLKAFRSNVVCCIWDRIKIIGGGVSQSQTNVGQTETVWFIGVYEYDNDLFKGIMGKLFLSVSENMHVIISDDPMNWSSEKDVWEGDYSFKTAGTRTFKISRVFDEKYNLTKIEDIIGPLNITWEARAPHWRPSILYLWVALIITGSGAVIIILYWILKKPTKLSINRGKNEEVDITHSPKANEEHFESYEFGKKDVEMTTVKHNWKDSKVGDVVTVQRGRSILRKRIVKVHRGSLARILMDVDYKRIFPDASTVFEAARATKELYPKDEEFMAFELEDVV